MPLTSEQVVQVQQPALQALMDWVHQSTTRAEASVQLVADMVHGLTQE
jgi:hypothetical protein